MGGEDTRKGGKRGEREGKRRIETDYREKRRKAGGKNERDYREKMRTTADHEHLFSVNTTSCPTITIMHMHSSRK